MKSEYLYNLGLLGFSDGSRNGNMGKEWFRQGGNNNLIYHYRANIN